MRAARRWTAPMKAPWPPPTMPSLMRPPCLASLRPSIDMCFLRLNSVAKLDAQHALDLLLVDLAGGEIVEGLLRHLDDMACDKGRALGRTLHRILQAAFPFEHRP